MMEPMMVKLEGINPNDAIDPAAGNVLFHIGKRI